jgi:O-antigen/teichoic acid export membrane protein
MTDKKKDTSKLAMKGMAWMSMAMFVTRGVGFITQLILGWLLSTDDFAIYAMAIASSSFFMAFRDGGLQQILIKRGKSYAYLAHSIARIYFILGTLVALLIVACSGLIADVYGQSEVQVLLVIIAISIPLSVPAQIMKAKLSIDLRFKEISMIGLYSSLFQQSSIVLLAFYGAGAYSFVLPLIFVALFEWVLTYFHIGPWPRKGKLNKRLVVALFSQSKWIILGALSTSLIMQGGNFVVSLFESTTIVALFFFGFQLTAALLSLLTSSFLSVLLPLFSRIVDNEKELRATYLEVLYKIFIISCPFSCGVVLLAPEMTSIIWAGKWDGAIPVIQFLSISMIVGALAPVGNAILSARGEWHKLAYFRMANGVGTLVATYIGVKIGGITAIAFSLMLFRLCFSFAHLFYLNHLLSIKFLDLCCLLYKPYIIFPLGAFALQFISYDGIVVSILIKFVLFLALCLSTVKLLGIKFFRFKTV